MQSNNLSNSQSNTERLSVRPPDLKPIKGATPEALLDALAAFVEEDLKDYELPVAKKAEGERGTRPVSVETLALEDPDDEESRIPYILLQPLNGKEERDKLGQLTATMAVRICVTIYNRNLREGRRQLLHIVERLRRDLMTARVIGGVFTLKLPIEWLIYPDDTESYHLAELSTEWSLPPTEVRVSGLW